MATTEKRLIAFKIGVASGKGGTGKTTVSVNLFNRLATDYSCKVKLADCDVEEPNAALFFPGARRTEVSQVQQEIPLIDSEKFTFCRKCVECCEFNAILVMPPVKFSEINPDLCHSCGACQAAFEHDAIRTHSKVIGPLQHYETETGRGIRDGTLNIGSSMQTMVTRTLKKSLPPNMDILLFDAPPGTSCPVVETIRDCDYVVLVTEPTPLGLHDLKLMTSLLGELKIPYGEVINKANLGNQNVHVFLREKRLKS